MCETREKDIGFLFKSLGDRMMARGNRHLSALGVTFSQLRVIEALCESERSGHVASPSDLERLLDVSQPTVAGILKRLEAKGIVATSVDPADRRCRIVALTDAGRAVADRARHDRDVHEAALTAGLTDKDVAELRRIVGRLIANIDTVEVARGEKAKEEPAIS